MSETNEPLASVVYREGTITPADYAEAIEFMQDAKRQLEEGRGWYCPCGDACGPGNCHHDPLVMARRAALFQSCFRCFHCGEVFATDEDARDHFGEKDALPACFVNKRRLEALIKAAVQLAIVRHDLNSEEGHTLKEELDVERIAQDTADAMRGVGTCAEEPVPQWKLLVDSGRELEYKLLALGAEFGYRQCEKGNNLDATLLTIYSPDTKKNVVFPGDKK